LLALEIKCHFLSTVNAACERPLEGAQFPKGLNFIRLISSVPELRDKSKVIAYLKSGVFPFASS
jgi:hypothetical protein